MNRRDLFKGILGAAAAASAVKAAQQPQPFPFCEICGAHHTASVACMQTVLSGLTAKQVEVWDALKHPDIRMVLFSGGRDCGRTFLADLWKKSLSPGVRQLHVRQDDGTWHMQPRSFRPFGGHFDSISIDDANLLPEETIMAAAVMLNPQGTLLLTGTPIGEGCGILRSWFPRTGWNGPARYHVNASMWDNPHL